MADLRATTTAAGVALTWADTGSSAHHWEVWRGSSPYFAPIPTEGSPIGADVPRPANPGDPISFTDEASHLGDPDINDYYFILSIGAEGQTSAPSNRVGVFKFRLQPGVAP